MFDDHLLFIQLYKMKRPFSIVNINSRNVNETEDTLSHLAEVAGNQHI